MNLIVQVNAKESCEFKISRPESQESFCHLTTYKESMTKDGIVPGCRLGWRSAFRRWIGVWFQAARKAGAPLFPEEGTVMWHLQELEDAFVLGLPIELNDPAIQSMWLEYLTEFPSRADWWRRFQKVKGACERL